MVSIWIIVVDIRNVKRKSDRIIKISPEEKRNLMNGILKRIEDKPLTTYTKKVTWDDMTNVKDTKSQ